MFKIGGRPTSKINFQMKQALLIDQDLLLLFLKRQHFLINKTKSQIENTNKPEEINKLKLTFKN